MLKAHIKGLYLVAMAASALPTLASLLYRSTTPTPLLSALPVFTIISWLVLFVLRHRFLAAMEAATRHELQLKDQLAQAKRECEDKGRVLEQTSHEVRTAMNSIQGATELLASSRLEPEQGEHLAMLRDATFALTGALEPLTDFASLETDSDLLQQGEFQLPTLVRRALTPLQVQLRNSRIDLQLQFGDGLPECVFGDENKLRRALVHLVSAIVEHTITGRISVRVQMAAIQEGGADYRFEVASSGTAVSDERQTAFSNSSWQNGGGFGISVARRLIALLGGELTVEEPSVQGWHCFFTVFLATPLVCLTTPAPTEPSALGSALPRRRVLVVEDNLLNQRMVRVMLEKMGQDVIVVGDGAQAMRFLRKETVDIVLLDLQMPVVDGYTVIRHIRTSPGLRVHPLVPVVAMTAHASITDRERCMAEGMSDYLAKPVSAASLRETLSRLLPT